MGQTMGLSLYHLGIMITKSLNKMISMCYGAEMSALEATCFWHSGQSLMGTEGLSLGHVRFLRGLSQANILIL